MSVHRHESRLPREGIEATMSASSGSVGRALEAAAIPLERTGRRRAAALAEPERRLYAWILKRFAVQGRPSMEATAAAANEFGIALDRTFASFARLDLVHLAEGEIAVAYPFAGRPTGHRVRIDGGQEVFAMCAIDALGIAPMLELPIEVLSRDPLSHGEVWVRIDPGDGAWWEPENAVVLAASLAGAEPSFRSCCAVLNFFESGENALQYLLVHPDVSGHPISLPEAVEAGRIIFGDVVKEA